MAWLDFFEFEIAPFWIAIVVGMGIGLSGAYAREFNDGKSPTKHWLRNRLLLYPFLALAAQVAAEALNLTETQAAFLAAILSLMAFDALRVIITRFQKKAEEAIEDMVPMLDPVIEPEQLIALPIAKRAEKSDSDEPVA